MLGRPPGPNGCGFLLEEDVRLFFDGRSIAAARDGVRLEMPGRFFEPIWLWTVVVDGRLVLGRVGGVGGRLESGRVVDTSALVARRCERGDAAPRLLDDGRERLRRVLEPSRAAGRV